MTDREILCKLDAEGYPMTLVAKQSGVEYARIYRAFRGKYPLNEEESAQLKAFAYLQPAFTRSVKA